MIRNVQTRDYGTIAEIHNACWPSHPTTAEVQLRLDRSFGRERFVFERRGEVVAQTFLETTRSETAYLDLDVRPDFQGRGFGSRLYAFFAPRLRDISSVTCFAREDHAFALAFAERRGFREVLRSWHQSLDVSHFDPAPFRDLETQLERDGYVIKGFSAISHPDRERKLHALYAKTLPDVPGVTDIPDFERYRARDLESPLFVPDATFVAMRGDEWVGYTGTRQRSQVTPNEWHTGMTGMLPEHRGRGLALALKLHAIELARARGILEIHTNNASTNAEMLAVNAKLGFLRGAAQVQLERTPSSTRV